MTSDSDEETSKPKAPKVRRPRRTQAEIFLAEYRAEEEAWKAQRRAERLAAGEPPPPRPKPFRFPTHIQLDEWGFPVWPKDRRKRYATPSEASGFPPTANANESPDCSP
jgi:hypothetical protein